MSQGGYHGNGADVASARAALFPQFHVLKRDVAFFLSFCPMPRHDRSRVQVRACLLGLAGHIGALVLLGGRLIRMWRLHVCGYESLSQHEVRLLRILQPSLGPAYLSRVVIELDTSPDCYDGMRPNGVGGFLHSLAKAKA